MFDSVWQFPFCFGVVDGCHIHIGGCHIKCTPGGLEGNKEYHNFKDFSFVVLMATVDFQYRFVWASCGHDGIIFHHIKNSIIPKNENYVRYSYWYLMFQYFHSLLG